MSGTKNEPIPKLLSPDIFRWGRGLPREGVGAKKFGMPLETREIKLFWRDIPGFCRDIPPSAPKKFEKKKFGFNFRSLQKLTPHCLAAIFDSQLPSPKLSPEMPRKLPLPHNSRTPKSTHHSHKIEDQHRECKTGGGAYFAFFLGSENSHTTPPKIPPEEGRLLWGWCVVGGPLNRGHLKSLRKKFVFNSHPLKNSQRRGACK